MIPAWLQVLLLIVIALTMASYFSPDMRAVFAAAWSACI